MSLSETPRPGTRRGAAVVMAERQAALDRDLTSCRETIKAMAEQVASLKKQIAKNATREK